MMPVNEYPLMQPDGVDYIHSSLILWVGCESSYRTQKHRVNQPRIEIFKVNPLKFCLHFNCCTYQQPLIHFIN